MWMSSWELSTQRERTDHHELYGISLCRLHHAAFDRYFLAVRPDHTIEVRADILEESDGPTLRHAIQGLHDTQIILPSGLCGPA